MRPVTGIAKEGEVGPRRGRLTTGTGKVFGSRREPESLKNPGVSRTSRGSTQGAATALGREVPKRLEARHRKCKVVVNTLGVLGPEALQEREVRCTT